MKSQEVVAIAESLQSEGEADRTDGLSGETLEASSLAELVESHSEAEDEEKKKIFECKFCHKTFDKFQALGGHMNKHPEDRNHEKMIQFEKLFEKMNSRPFQPMNPREHMPGTSSYPFNNFNQPGDSSNMVSQTIPMQPSRLIQQPWQQMEPLQAWQAPMDPQQLSWPQASTNAFDLTGGPANHFTIIPNPAPTYVASDAAVDGNYGPLSMDPSLSRLTTEQYNSVPGPSSMSSNAMYGYYAPCTSPCCNPLTSGPYQDPQMDMYTLEQGKNSLSTLNWDQPCSLTPPDVQMNAFIYVQYAQGLPTFEMGIQETDAVHGTINIPNPLDAYASGSNHSQMFNEWSGKPTDHTH